MKIYLATLAVFYCVTSSLGQTGLTKVLADEVPLPYPVLDPFFDLQAPEIEGQLNIEFGRSVVVQNGQLIVTIPRVDLGLPLPFNFNEGRVEIYDIKTGQLRDQIEPETAIINQRFGRTLGTTEQYTWVTSHASPSVIDIYDADMKNHVYRIKLEPYAPISASSGYANRACVAFSPSNSQTDGVAVLYNLSDGTPLASFEHGSAGFVDTSTQSIAMDGTQIAVLNMDYNKDIPYMSPGRVDVYNASTYELEYIIRPEEPSVGFGMNIAMNSRYIAVGNVTSRGGSSTTRYGNIELYDRTNGELVWRFVSRDTDLQYANTIAMNEKFIAVGSMWTNTVYLLSIEDPENVHRLGKDGRLFERSRFGSSLSMDEHILVVGSPTYSTRGAVFMYDIECRADMDGDGRNTFADVAEFLRLLEEQDPQADLNGDGMQNYFDISLYLKLFYEQCL